MVDEKRDERALNDDDLAKANGGWAISKPAPPNYTEWYGYYCPRCKTFHDTINTNENSTCSSCGHKGLAFSSYKNYLVMMGRMDPSDRI